MCLRGTIFWVMLMVVILVELFFVECVCGGDFFWGHNECVPTCDVFLVGPSEWLNFGVCLWSVNGSVFSGP